MNKSTDIEKYGIRIHNIGFIFHTHGKGCSLQCAKVDFKTTMLKDIENPRAYIIYRIFCYFRGQSN